MTDYLKTYVLYGILLLFGWRTQAGEAERNIGSYTAGDWLAISLSINTKESPYTLTLNGETVLQDAKFARPVESVERLSFRTGARSGVLPE